jgi:hypothetical protein
VKIKGQNTIQRLFKKDFNIAELGIGGLDAQFAEIFRGAFASRAVPGHIAKAMSIQHTKGILLYGPPGTGTALHQSSRMCMHLQRGALPLAAPEIAAVCALLRLQPHACCGHMHAATVAWHRARAACCTIAERQSLRAAHVFMVHSRTLLGCRGCDG